MNLRQLTLIALAIGLTAGCRETKTVDCLETPADPACIESCMNFPDQVFCMDGFMPPDMNGGDMDVDMPPADAGPCGMCADGTVCDPGSGACVDCLGDGDCDGERCLVDDTDPTMNACVACLGDDDCGDDRCDTGTNVCVACLGDADCTDPAAARCDTASNTCTACDDSAQCAGTGENECVSGACVECTEATAETHCGAKSCNPATSECTGTDRGSLTRCDACVSDTECGLADDRCVAMRFMGAARPGGYCLKRFSTGCVSPYRVDTDARPSLSGAAPEVYCGIREDATTCEAVLDLVDDEDCATATECGAAELEDAECATVAGAANKCTYSCGASSQCPGGLTCGNNGMYCGAPNI